MIHVLFLYVYNTSMTFTEQLKEKENIFFKIPLPLASLTRVLLAPSPLCTTYPTQMCMAALTLLNVLHLWGLPVTVSGPNRSSCQWVCTWSIHQLC